MKSVKSVKQQNAEITDELMKLVFEKAEKESKQTTTYGLSNYLALKFEDEKVKLSVPTFEKYHRGYILKKEEKHKPNKDTKDALSEYLGYLDYEDFYKKNTCLIENKELRSKLKLSMASGALLLIALTFFILKYYKKNCMIWTGEHYEKIRCSGLELERSLDITLLEKFKQIKACDTTTFFNNGKEIVWYDKSNNNLTYFTYSGDHPFNGKTLKPITQGIIDAHIKPCDSVKNGN